MERRDVWWDEIVEQRIREARDQGAFDDLPGYGKPLKLDDNERGEDWIGNRMLREAGLLPEWLQLRKDIYYLRPGVLSALHAYRTHAIAFRDGHRVSLARLRELEQRYVELAREINRKIDLHNLRCPSIDLEIPRFMEDAIQRERRRLRLY